MAEGNDDGGKSLHWSELLAQDIIGKKREPFVISAGLTTSGPTHLGTVCEFLFPQAITDALRFAGKKAEYYFVADIFDAFDSVPAAFEQHKSQLEPHLGKPLTSVPDPTGQTPSFGEHFLADATHAMEKFGVKPKIIRASEFYSSGAFDRYARLFLAREPLVREIVAKTSMREKLPDWWSPIMPLCAKCGKIATTRVLSHDGGNYEYACDRDVKYAKGCGHLGKSSIAEHGYKLTWRLHWPAWMDHLGTSAEGAGVDHHTQGGSWDTLVEIFRQVFQKEPPIGYKFGFILFEGKKYSKSKGTGMGVRELMALLPPEVLKYMLLKPDLQENVDIVPSPANLLRTIEDYEKAIALFESGNADSLSRAGAGAQAEEQGATQAGTDKDAAARAGAKESAPEPLSRADRKRVIAARLASESASGGRGWKTPFLDLLLYRQLGMGWEKIAQLTGDGASVSKLSQFVEQWGARGFIPEEYSFSYSPKKAQGASADFFSRLSPHMRALEIHNLAFSTAKELSVPPARLFEECYTALLGKPRGPKLGKLIETIGVERVRKDVL